MTLAMCRLSCVWVGKLAILSCQFNFLLTLASAQYVLIKTYSEEGNSFFSGFNFRDVSLVQHKRGLVVID
jgi:hypothetical protein